MHYKIEILQEVLDKISIPLEEELSTVSGIKHIPMMVIGREVTAVWNSSARPIWMLLARKCATVLNMP